MIKLSWTKMGSKIEFRTFTADQQTIDSNPHNKVIIVGLFDGFMVVNEKDLEKSKTMVYNKMIELANIELAHIKTGERTINGLLENMNTLLKG